MSMVMDRGVTSQSNPTMPNPLTGSSPACQKHPHHDAAKATASRTSTTGRPAHSIRQGMSAKGVRSIKSFGVDAERASYHSLARRSGQFAGVVRRPLTQPLAKRRRDYARGERSVRGPTPPSANPSRAASWRARSSPSRRRSRSLSRRVVKRRPIGQIGGALQRWSQPATRSRRSKHGPIGHKASVASISLPRPQHRGAVRVL